MGVYAAPTSMLAALEIHGVERGLLQQQGFGEGGLLAYPYSHQKKSTAALWLDESVRCAVGASSPTVPFLPLNGIYIPGPSQPQLDLISLLCCNKKKSTSHSGQLGYLAASDRSRPKYFYFYIIITATLRLTTASRTRWPRALPRRRPSLRE